MKSELEIARTLLECSSKSVKRTESERKITVIESDPDPHDPRPSHRVTQIQLEHQNGTSILELASSYQSLEAETESWDHIALRIKTDEENYEFTLCSDKDAPQVGALLFDLFFGIKVLQAYPALTSEEKAQNDGRIQDEFASALSVSDEKDPLNEMSKLYIFYLINC